MKTTNRWTLRGVAGLGLAAFSIAALAQTTGSGQEIKIEANKVVTVAEGHFPNATQKVQLSRTVGIADLNLATAAGTSELKSRIEGVATQICEQLGSLYPAASPGGEVNERAACVKSSVDTAMSQARLAIASAQKGKQR